jgi:hypothetical protein
VLEALYELLRGFQAANDQSKGDLLREVLARDPDHVYRGLLTTLLRLVFVLFAEDRGLLSTDPIYSNYYSLTGLYERLRADAGRYPDTMDQRYGAWAQLLALFGLMYSGGSHGAMKIPAREGYLFDPERYLFLEGRHDKKDKPEIPRVSDGVVFRVLTKLLLLDGERLSYRTLAVEQIGSVYQAIMGFSLQVATGRSIAIKPAKKHGAPATVNLEQLLATPADKRLKRFTDETDQKLTGQAADALKSAKTIDDLMPALQRKIATTVTPTPVPKGAMIFQPSDERRKSGSHYTPSSLTGPIVEAALAPVLKQLGATPTPAQILNLKVCDLAMGSAAFLVEACRQLGDALSKAWHSHGEVPSIPLDEDEALYAQRLIAQRCLYGLDKNQMAADLAKLSLWLATLAKEHPFTFLDHSLRHGDALVGLTRREIASFNWAPSAQQTFLEEKIRHLVDFVSSQRREILDARENTPYAQLEQELAVADERLSLPRMIGDAAVAAFFSAEKPKERDEVRNRLLVCIADDLKKQGFISVDGDVDRAIQALRKGPQGVTPFHWELEFPEVFVVDNMSNVTGGFDAIIGNPPFLGGTKISTALGVKYLHYLGEVFTHSGNRMDLVGYFFRRAFSLVRERGCLGLIGSNTIAQGDTRTGGLAVICASGGTIYSAVPRIPWPGQAAVVVSVIHISRGNWIGQCSLNKRLVNRISAFLVSGDLDDVPQRLVANARSSFEGFMIAGQGFLFDDEDPTATPISEMRRLIEEDPRNQSVIFPYLGGKELNTDPNHQPHRYAINFGTMTEAEAMRWPSLYALVKEKVKPERDAANRASRQKRWWQYGETRPGLVAAVKGLNRVLVCSQTGSYISFAFVPTNIIWSTKLKVFPDDSFSFFCVMQSRAHELWARFFGSTMKDDPVYVPTDCFETFAFPDPRQTATLETAGKNYYEFRAALMLRNDEGLTATYNRFHDPEEDSPDIVRLRELHDAMDYAVLDAYGWTEVQRVCQFIPEFENEEDEDENGLLKKKCRYRWPDEIRDEVLARLLELNRQRALEEGQAVANPAAALDAKPKKTSNSKSRVKQGSTSGLFAMDHEEA